MGESQGGLVLGSRSESNLRDQMTSSKSVEQRMVAAAKKASRDQRCIAGVARLRSRKGES